MTGVAAGLVCLLLISALFLGRQITIFLEARWMARKFPAVWVTPQPLMDISSSSAPGTTLTYFGYAFEVPWTGGKKQRLGDNLAAVNFNSGQSIIFKVPTDQTGFLNDLADDKTFSKQSIRAIFGTDLDASAYAQETMLLNVTPSRVNAFGSRTEATRSIMLLNMKAIAAPSGLQTGAYSFELPNLHGFQLGDPSRSSRVDLEIYDLGGHYVELTCIAKKGSPQKLTQTEINRILQTIHPAPASAPCVPTVVKKALPKWPKNVTGAESHMMVSVTVDSSGRVSKVSLVKVSRNAAVDAAAIASAQDTTYSAMPAACGDMDSNLVYYIDF